MPTWLDMFRKPRKYKARIDSNKKRERLMDRTVATAIATNPEVEREWIETKYGIYYSEVDPIVMAADKLREKWSEQAVQILGEDEKSQESVIRALVNEIKKNNALAERLRDEVEAGFNAADEDVESNPIVRKRRLRREREKIEQLRDSSKNNRPAAEDNTNPATRIFSEWPKRISSAGTEGASSRTIAVEIDGTLMEMSREAYEIFKKQREELRALQARSKDLPRPAAPDNEPPLSESNSADAGE
jgi:hypothetical protein